MPTRIFSIMVVLIALLLTTCKQTPPPFECADAIGCVDIAPGEPVKLGVLQALSGGVASTGNDQIRGIELALAAHDNQLFGHPFELQIEDERCTSEGGAVAAMKVVADPQTVAIIGTTCSGAAMTAAKVMSEAGLVMISGVNSAPSLTAISGKHGADWQPGYFRTRHNEAVGIEVATTFVFQELGVIKVATINDGDTYTQGVTDIFEQTFTESGGEIVLTAAINKGDSDMKPVLTTVAASEAELLFFPIFPTEGTHIIRQAKETTGLENILFLGGDALISNNFIESVGADGLGMYFTSQSLPKSSAFHELISAYEARYGEPLHTGISIFISVYDAANLLLAAIETVASQEKDGTLHIGRQALRKALYATADLEGVSDKITCDEFGDCGAGKFNIVRLDDLAAGIEGLRSNVVYTYRPDIED